VATIGISDFAQVGAPPSSRLAAVARLAGGERSQIHPDRSGCHTGVLRCCKRLCSRLLWLCLRSIRRRPPAHPHVKERQSYCAPVRRRPSWATSCTWRCRRSAARWSPAPCLAWWSLSRRGAPPWLIAAWLTSVPPGGQRPGEQQAACIDVVRCFRSCRRPEHSGCTAERMSGSRPTVLCLRRCAAELRTAVGMLSCLDARALPEGPTRPGRCRARGCLRIILGSRCCSLSARSRSGP